MTDCPESTDKPRKLNSQTVNFSGESYKYFQEVADASGVTISHVIRGFAYLGMVNFIEDDRPPAENLVRLLKIGQLQP